MDFIVADELAMIMVIEPSVILRVVINFANELLESKKGPNIKVLIPVQIDLPEYLFQMVLRIEDGGLVHIVPESVHSLGDQPLVLAAKPLPCFLIQKIREVHPSRPDRRYQIFSIFLFAEVLLFNSFFVDIIAFFDLDAGIDNRDKVNSLLFHLPRKPVEVRECLVVNREVLVVVHVVNIEVYAVNRDSGIAIRPDDLKDLLFIHVAPTALSVTKRPLGWNITFSDQIMEAAYDFRRILPLNRIDICGKIIEADFHLIHFGISDVKRHLPRCIHEHSITVLSGKNEKEVLGSIKRMLIFRVVRIIAVIALVDPAALIHPPDRLSKAIYDLIFRKIPAQRSLRFVLYPSGNSASRHRNISDHCSGLDRCSELKVFYRCHPFTPPAVMPCFICVWAMI